MDYVWRFLLGGTIVSVFALIGDVVRPKRFAGLFGGAPSVALATLALTISQSGAATASLEARSMILGGFGFVVYACACQRLLASGRWPAFRIAIGALLIWGLATFAAAALLLPAAR
jgi:hypothetical protein